MIWIAVSVVVLTLGAALAVLLLDNLLAAVGAGLSRLILALALRRIGIFRLDIDRPGDPDDA